VAASASISSNGGVTEESGTVDDKNYVARIPSAVCTTYQGGEKSASGLGCEYNKTCASHNMPYGTKIYIPQLKDKLGGDGVLTVTDTGGCFLDFDLYTTNNIGKTNADVYVLEWGTGKVAPSYTWAINFYLENGRWKGLVPAWNTYKNMGGKLITFTKYNQEDANITNHPNYNDK
jgi:3D (Asp-Asp-Asp) domain-containing protein